jgi:pimeloyl-ACP methyl ester carboxylesterase
VRRSDVTARDGRDGGDMRKHLRWLLAVALMASCAPAMAAEAPLAWEPCPDNPAVSCGAVPLPVDWSAPGGKTFDLAVARRTVPNPVGTLVYLPAGPGSSGVDAMTNDQIFGLLFPPEVAQRFDIVGFDPRGVRRSHPVRCDSALVAGLDVPTPRNQTEFDALLAAQAAVGADCRERTGALFDHLDSTDTARDVDGLRRRLGVEQLNLYGLSYGTVIGQMYAERFPNRIRTMVLDAVFDHSVDSDRFAVTGARAAQESFDRFVAWCGQTPDCVLHGTDVRATVADLFTRAENGSLPGVDPTALTHRIVTPLTQPNLPATAAAIAQLSTAGAPVAAGEGLTPLPIFIQCADNRNRTSSYAAAEALRTRSREVAPDVRETAYGIASLCVNPPVQASNPQRPLHVPGAPQVLVMNSRYDASTPYEGARRVADQIDGAVLVTYDGMGHGAATRTDCTRAAMSRYLIDRLLPGPETHCPSA